MTEPANTTPEALHGALREVLAPLARLALARGITDAQLQAVMRLALVEAADAEHAALPPHRRVSRIATATGIHRREVTRLVELLRGGAARQAPAQRSLASELFTHWRTAPQFHDLNGSPAELPRTGPAPSFEALARAVTTDVHPRSLLDELQRLGLVAHDRQRDTVRLLREAFVPQGDEARSLRVLGLNVGAHLAAAVDNVLVSDRQHFEQAVFAAGLSDQSMAEVRLLVRGQWQALLQALVPALEAMVARDAAAAAGPAASSDQPGAGDAAAAPQRRHRLRLGLYTHAREEAPVAPAAPAAPAPDAGPAPRARSARPKTPKAAP